MNGPDTAAIDRLMESAQLGPVQRIVPLAGGANNRAFRVEHQTGLAFLKQYFRHPADPRDRLRAEFAFLRYANAAGLASVPRALAGDAGAGLGLFEYAQARMASAEDVTDSRIEKVIEFVRELNAERWRPAATLLLTASEACFSLEEHLSTVNRRIDRLRGIAPRRDIDREAADFAQSSVLPLWKQVEQAARVEAIDCGFALDRAIDRCVSPSDFGFHNVLIDAADRLTFVDFEYAGWDDPAKLICDFFCQPRIPIPTRYFARVAREIAGCAHHADATVARARLLLPVYQVKWVCILLNEFLRVSQERRAFSRSDDQAEARKSRQLALARLAIRRMSDREARVG